MIKYKQGGRLNMFILANNIMKKRIFTSVALLAMVLTMGACGSNSNKKLDLDNLKGISREEYSTAMAQAAANSRYLSKMSAVVTTEFDNTKLYTGGLSSIANSSSRVEKADVEIGSNYAVYQTASLNVTSSNKTGTVKSESTAIATSYLMKNPNSTASPVLYDMCTEQSMTEDGVTSKTNEVNNEGVATDETVAAFFQVNVVQDIASQGAFTNTYAIQGKQGDAIVAYTKTITSGSEANPLYPGDTTKKISYTETNVKAIKLIKNSKLGYVLDQEYESNTKSYPTNLELEKIASPIITAQESESCEYKYEDLKALTLPSYPAEEVDEPVLVFSTFNKTSPYALVSTASLALANVTDYEKSINKDYNGTKYSGVVKFMASGNYVSFSTQEATELDTPIYEKYGFGNITASSIVGDTVQDAKIADHNFISVKNGYYSMTVEFDNGGVLKTLSMSYVAPAY